MFRKAHTDTHTNRNQKEQKAGEKITFQVPRRYSYQSHLIAKHYFKILPSFHVIICP